MGEDYEIIVFQGISVLEDLFCYMYLSNISFFFFVLMNVSVKIVLYRYYKYLLDTSHIYEKLIDKLIKI